QTVAQCVAAAPGVQKAVIGALISADNTCGGLPPVFGPPSINAHGARAVALTGELLTDLFGSSPESALAPNSTVMNCQTAVLKTAGKCEDVRLNAFNKCKKSGLKQGFIADKVDLQTTCLGTTSTQPDPSGGKIQSTCVVKPVGSIQSSCLSRGV